MASVTGPLKLSPKAKPANIQAAIDLLKANGYTILNKAPVEIGSFQDVTLLDFHHVPQAELAQRTIRALGSRLGHEALLHATISAEPTPREGRTEYRARLLVVPVGEVVGPTGLNIRNPSL